MEGGNKNEKVGYIKTASCQLELSGGKRKWITGTEDKDSGGKPIKIQKHVFFSGNKEN